MRRRSRSLHALRRSISRAPSMTSLPSNLHDGDLLADLPPVPALPIRTDAFSLPRTQTVLSNSSHHTVSRSRAHLRTILALPASALRRSKEKAELYTKEVDRVRLRGHWVAETVGHEAKGKGVGWPELLRKYAKHNPNKQASLAVITIEQSLRSSLIAFYREEGYNDLSQEEDDASPKKGRTLFPPNVPTDRAGHGWSGSEYEKTAAQLESHASDTRADDGKQQGIVAIYAHALFTLGRDEEAVGLLHDSHFLETVNTDQVRPEEQSDEYQTALFMMGFVTYGMANERLHEARPQAGYHPFAFAGYARAIELHEELRGGRRAKALPGLPEDEIERWAETALYRNALFSVREGDASLGLNALRAYQAHVSRWPKDFRLPQRNVINRTYLRELNAGLEQGFYAPPPAAPGKSKEDWRSQAYQRAVVAGVASRVYIRDFTSERKSKSGLGRRSEAVGSVAKTLSSRTVSTRRPFPGRSFGPPSSLWANEMQTVSKMAAANVLRSSEFPRAGKVNLSALLLADELFKGWQYNGELGGPHADEIVESLYTLSRLTFHSQRISRHLFTLLTASQAYSEARCALELYISIVDKAREGDAAGSAALVEESKLRAKKQEDEGYDLEGIKKKEKEEEDKPPEEKVESKQSHGGGVSEKAKKAASQVSIDADDDSTFVNTLLAGAHVLRKFLGDAVAANAMAKKALTIVKKSGEGKNATIDSEHTARALRIAGETRAAWGLKTAVPEHLPSIHRETVELLEESLRLDSQSSEAWYALAHVQAQMGETRTAIGFVRKAIELEPADVKSWHLLVLLVSATKDFDAAFKLAEAALDEAEADDEADSAQSATTNGSVEDHANLNGSSAAIAAPTSRTQLLSVDFPPTTLDRAENILHLMVTQNALEELVSGTEVAIGSQKDLFLFFHDRIAFHIESAPGTRAGLSNGSGAENGNAGTAHSHGLSRLLHFGSSGKKGTGMAGGNAASGLGRSGAQGGFARDAYKDGPASSEFNGRDGPLALNGDADAGADGNGSYGPAPIVNSPLGTSATPADARKAYQHHRETSLLSDLWLLSSASFRRSGQMAQSRNAIQEAERLDAGRPQLWTQLALLSEKVGEVPLAVEALHKALACERDHVPANVHLARLFITKEEEVLPDPSSNQLSKAGAALAKGEKDSTRSRCIAGDLSSDKSTGSSEGPLSKDAVTSPVSTGHGGSTIVQVLSSPSTRNVATLSLAEGLLVTSTTSPAAGGSSADAWLYLGQVYQKTQRRERARECLRYALRLEERRMVRDLACLGR